MIENKPNKKVETPIVKKEVEVPKVETPIVKVEVETKKDDLTGTFIMKVSHLSWGYQNKNHFFADDKPLISSKSMGKYSGIMEIWLSNNWIEKGTYK
jgi:hypothetical protein